MQIKRKIREIFFSYGLRTRTWATKADRRINPRALSCSLVWGKERRCCAPVFIKKPPP
jgi:hypothetical protein